MTDDLWLDEAADHVTAHKIWSPGCPFCTGTGLDQIPIRLEGSTSQGDPVDEMCVLAMTSYAMVEGRKDG